MRRLTASLLVWLCLLAGLSGEALADSAAVPSTIGYLSTSCGTQAPPCFIQYGSTLPVSASITFPTIGAAVPATGIYMAGNLGGVLTGVTLDGSSNLDVNCVVGCSGGTFNNNADGVATSATNGQAASWEYIWGGSNWNRVYQVANSFNSTGAGLQAVGLTAQCDDTTPTAITENQWGNVRMGCADHALVTAALKAGVATALNMGSQTSANSLSVVIASDYGLAAGSTTSGQLGSIVMCASTTGNPSNTTAQTNFFSCDLQGGVRIGGEGTAGTATGGVVTVQGVASMTPVQVSQATAANLNATVVGTGTFAAQATLQTQTDTVMVGGVNVKEINGVTPLMGNGVTGTGSPRVTIASDNTTLTNTFGNVGEVPVTSGGQSFTTLTLANSTNATNVKASAGQLYTISGFNMSSATPVWISLYNNAGTPTCGTSIVAQFMIPGNTTGAGFVYNVTPGMAFSTGIAFCATTGIAGTGSAAASTYVVNFGFK